MIHSPHVLKDTPISAEMWVCAVQTCGNVIRRQWDCASTHTHTHTHFKHRLVICPQWVVDIYSSRFLYDSAPEINIRHKCSGFFLLNAQWLAFCAALVHLRRRSERVFLKQTGWNGVTFKLSPQAAFTPPKPQSPYIAVHQKYRERGVLLKIIF